MSEKVWSRLEPEQQRMIQQAADESMHYQRKIWNEMVEESLQKVREAGVEVGIPDKKPFMEKVKPLYEEFAGTEIGRYAERIRQVR